MSSEIIGTKFKYTVDTSYGINQDGFIAIGTESIVYKGLKTADKGGKYKSDLKSLKSKVLKIDSSICNVDDVINSVKSSTQTQGDKIDALDNLKKDVNEFVADVVRIDGDAADAINQSKNDFYDKYEYLKPDIEKNWLEEKVDNACEWCKEHWKEILITVTIVIGAVLAIVAVVASGGLALVPLLTTTLTTL